jgi:ethanolamine utilization protein EutN
MLICRVVGDVVSTQKNAHLEGHKLLLVQPVDLDGTTPLGTSLIAVDKVDAGDGDLVLVNKEGGSARLLLDDDEIPVQAVIVGVIDGMDVVKQ